jgi:hypothetical protein
VKLLGTHRVKGQLTELDVIKINLFDGRFDTGYRIVEFLIAPQSPSAQLDGYATLGTEEGTLSNGTWEWQDNTQIAWASFSEGGGLFSPAAALSIIDPDNMVIEDLYVYANSSVSNQKLNYMIVMEKYDLTEWEGALQLVRNSSQG